MNSRKNRTARRTGAKHAKNDTVKLRDKLGIVGSLEVVSKSDLGFKRNTVAWVRSVFMFNFNNVAATSANVRMYATALGPAANIASEGTTSRMQNDLSLFSSYPEYFVFEVDVNYELQNRQTADSVLAYIGWINRPADISKNDADFPTKALAPQFHEHLLGNAGYISWTRSGKFHLDVIKCVGNKKAAYDANFTATTNPSGNPTAPVNNVIIVVGGVIGGGSGTFATNQGLTVKISLAQRVLFFERNNPI